LLPENIDAWQLWFLCSTQWRMGPRGPVGLDYNTVMAVADVYGIDMSPATVRKLKALETSILKSQAAELKGSMA
jgi:UDP-N-acetyl-D-mannosaminuronate dehydrogenase